MIAMLSQFRWGQLQIGAFRIKPDQAAVPDREFVQRDRSCYWTQLCGVLRPVGAALRWFLSG